MPDENKPSIETLAVQMKYVAETLNEIKENLSTHTQAVSKIPVIEKELEIHSEQLSRAFSSIKSVREISEANSNSIIHSKGAFKVVSALMSFMTLVSMSIAGWSYNQLDALKATDRDLLLRISGIEIRNSEAEKRVSMEDERFSKRGWVRK